MSDLKTPKVVAPIDMRQVQRFDWVRVSVISGFVATFAMTVAIAVGYLIAQAGGDAVGSTFQQWLYGLTENEMTRQVGDAFAALMVLNLIVGLVLAGVYARFAEPMLSGPGWRRGALFSLAPWLLSILVLFPVMGAGFLARNVDAGPLAVLGDLAVHLVYGAVLGTMFAIEEGEGNEDNASERATSASAERGAAFGIAIGGVLGFIGGWFIAPSLEGLASQPVIGIAGALSGAAVGTLIGSLVSMVDDSEPVSKPRDGNDDQAVVDPVIQKG